MAKRATLNTGIVQLAQGVPHGSPQAVGAVKERPVYINGDQPYQCVTHLLTKIDVLAAVPRNEARVGIKPKDKPVTAWFNSFG